MLDRIAVPKGVTLKEPVAMYLLVSFNVVDGEIVDAKLDADYTLKIVERDGKQAVTLYNEKAAA